ncbi:hypothetical protein S2091_4380 [Solimicrobium silvestre]|uniref:Uncharacterized protein n=1 Tax=Solimicrobium silvestre TaxID=2099400 RepID=A0A2S9GT43_9BURK|nr:hypothetical protein S2091_4380 [Solimicrobium silvestre]
MSQLIANQTSSAEVIKLIQQGQSLQCPVCFSVIKTVPENWKPGMVLHGIECPNDQKHFMIHCDDGQAMKEVRARMKARASKI